MSGISPTAIFTFNTVGPFSPLAIFGSAEMQGRKVRTVHRSDGFAAAFPQAPLTPCPSKSCLARRTRSATEHSDEPRSASIPLPAGERDPAPAKWKDGEGRRVVRTCEAIIHHQGFIPPPRGGSGLGGWLIEVLPLSVVVVFQRSFAAR